MGKERSETYIRRRKERMDGGGGERERKRGKELVERGTKMSEAK
jgi:hypothetical protein